MSAVVISMGRPVSSPNPCSTCIASKCDVPGTQDIRMLAQCVRAILANVSQGHTDIEAQEATLWVGVEVPAVAEGLAFGSKSDGRYVSNATDAVS